MTQKEIQALNLAMAVTKAITELEQCAALYKELFPNDLAHTKIDFSEIKGYVPNARHVIVQELEAMDVADGWMRGKGENNESDS